MVSREAREREETLGTGHGKQGSWQLGSVGPTQGREDVWAAGPRAA
jgi:hypothetical protein